ncbi:MAG: PEP-CTERM sorting domain-containing protein [Bryobacteraceae bacterium]
MRLQLGSALFAAFLVLASRAAYADTVLYSTGFETPTFTTGPLNGQNNWSVFGPGTPTVESSFADTGSQAVFVDGGAASQSGPYYAISSSGPLIDLSADIAIFTSSTETEWQFGALGPGLVGYLGGINIEPNGDIYAITAVPSEIGTFTKATAFNSAAWQNINLLFDIATQTYSVSLNGTLLASNIPFCGSNSTCTGANISSFGDAFFDSFGNGNDSAYMDNFSIVSVSPEPSMIFPMAAVLAGIGAARRRRLSAR